MRDARQDRLARIAAAQPACRRRGRSRRGCRASPTPPRPARADRCPRRLRRRRSRPRGSRTKRLRPRSRRDRHDRKPVHFEHRGRPQLPRLLERSRDVDLASDHESRERLQRRRRGIDGRDRPTAAQHCHAVGDRLHLVELVRDEDDGLPLLGHRAERLEERLGLLRREHCGRLVHDQDARVAVERLQDLDALLLADRELPDPRLRIDREPVALAQLLDALLGGARMTQDDAATLAAVVAEDDVLRDRERLDQPEVLVHHADPRVERVARRVEADPLAPELDLTLVLPVEPGQDVRERRLPRAVLAEERVHLAVGGLEADAVVRHDAGKPLGDSGHADGGSERGAGRTGASLILRSNGGSVPHAASRAAGPSRPCRPRP